jgi:hypothetical protein
MPTFLVTSPDGRKFRVNAPDGATEQDAIAYVQQGVSVDKPKEQEVYDPSEGMSGVGKFAAGYSKAYHDQVRGLGQIAQLVPQEEIDASKKRDEPLMQHGPAIAGNVLGTITSMIGPGAALGLAGKVGNLPKIAEAGRRFLMPRTVAGAAGTGAATGAVQPVATNESRLFNTGVGAVGAGLIPAGMVAGKGIKSLFAPFTKGGQEQIAGRALGRFAADPSSLSRMSGEIVPGSMPTLADATQDIGIAQLQRTLRNNPDANIAISERMIANQGARTKALQEIAGEPGQREFFDEARSRAAQELYTKAFSEQPVNTAWVRGQITQLMKRPTFREAWKDAATVAADEGVRLEPKNLVQVTHYTKLALDRKIESLTGKPTAQRAAISVKDKLVSVMESKDFAPSYREARETFAQMSRPINQMDLGQELVNRLQPALSDFGANVRTTPEKYAQAVRNIDQTAKTATGFRGARADKILDPSQMQTVENVAKDLGRSVNAENLGAARGSPTAQNFISQDILRQVLGPAGVPQSFAENALAQTVMRPASFAFKEPERRVVGLLGQAMADPAEARKLYELSRRTGIPIEQLIPFVAAPGAAGLLGLTK